MKEMKWASLGCGVIANELAQALEKEGKHLYAVANRTHRKAVDFAQKYDIPVVCDTIDDLFEDENVDIIYISTPHNTHMEFIRKALKKGKHVLCEKSITLNSDELEEAMRLASENGVIFAEAMTIFHMPLYQKLKEIVEDGSLGKLQMIQMNFGSFKEYDMENRFFNRELAGGALLDIGVYALSFIRWFMTQKPDQILSQVRMAPSGVDEQAGILLMNPAGEMATAALTLHAKQPKRGLAAFEKGYIEVYNYPRADRAEIVYTEDGRVERIESGDTEDALLYEIHDMEQAVLNKENKMYLEYTKDVMEIMTEIRKSWNFSYPEEL